MSLKKISEFFQAFFIVCLYLFLKALPVTLSSFLTGKIARLLGPILPVSRLGKRNLLEAFPHKTDSQRLRILRDAWENLGRVVGEFPHVQELAQKRTRVVNSALLEYLKKNNRAAIFISAHLANWELPHYTVVKAGLPIHLVSRPPNNVFTRKFLELVRSHPLVSLIIKGSLGTKQLLCTLRNSGYVGVLADQRLSEGQKVNFFGKQAFTAIGPGKLALKYECPLIPVHVVREKNATFQVSFLEPLLLKGKSEMEIAQEINDLFEDWIRQNPGQWLWFHNRWRL